jgi:tRNA(Ile)-lysidine synthase
LQQLADEIAEDDLHSLCHRDGSLHLSKLRMLSDSRQMQAVRYWLRNIGGEESNPTLQQMRILQREVMSAGEDAEPELLLGKVLLRRFRDRLYRLPPLPDHDATAEYVWPLSATLEIESLGITLEPQAILAMFTEFSSATEVVVRFRHGGERICLPGQKHHRSLKLLFQEWGVPPWWRDRIPLLYHDGRLILIWGYASGI